MNLTIDQQNLHLLLPGKLSWMAKMYIDDHKTSVVDALRALYKSPTYASLEQENRSCGSMDLLLFMSWWMNNGKNNSTAADRNQGQGTNLSRSANHCWNNCYVLSY
mgnify:CR=1 FL=1